ncbi:MAG TPA: sulfite exporter TauE/SafE family protein [Bacteriovoracaceae bacterium]|nr:sulfite exporter TauE/SafE family protein [Bacteriovoracaceae bacterium]
MGSYFLLFLLVTLGSLITSLTGLGGGTLILAGLLLAYPPEVAIPLHSFTQLVANGLRAGIFFKKVNWKVVGAYASLMLPFAWLAAEVFEHVNPSVLKIVVGVFILISIIPWKWKPKDEPHLRTFVMAGAASGFLGVFVGAVGPMVTPFFNRLKMSREGNLSTKSAGQMFLQLSKIIAFSGAAGIDFIALKENIGILVLGSLVGVLISIPIGKKIPDAKFELAVNILLGLISIKVLVEGINELL